MQAKKVVERYIEFCLNPENVVSSWVRKLCQRHLDDLERAKQPNAKFYFSEPDAQHVLNVFGHLQFSQGRWRGKPFELLDWQTFVLWLAYGWRRVDNDQRRFNKVYIKVARKNGKTEFLAGIGIYGQYFDREEKDAQVYWFATKKDQATIGFDRQKAMTEQLIRKSPGFAMKARVMQYRIRGRDDNSFTAYLGQDSKGEDGLSPFYGLCDEYHAHPTDGMMHVIESGMGSRVSPMMWIITTAGVLPDGPCARFEKICKQVLDGLVESDDVLPVIFDLDPADDWQDEKNWGKPNPGLGASVSIDFLRAEYRKAMTEGVAKQMNFQTKNLNIWQKSVVAWVKAEDWRANTDGLTRADIMERMKARLCFGGLDLASTKDLCTLALAFPPLEEGEPWYLLQWSWAPEETIDRRSRLDAVPYLQWVNDGYLITTPGNVTDYAYIKNKVLEVQELFDLHSVGFDRASSYKLIPELIDEGVEMQPFGQGYVSMSAPSKSLEVMALSKQLEHGSDPVLAWAMSNVAIQTDAAGNIKPDKDRSADKIDPIVATIMAVGQANLHLTEIESRTGSPVLIIKG